MTAVSLYRAALLDYTGDPAAAAQHARYVEDGALAVSGGKVVRAGDYAALAPLCPAATLVDYRGALILPGFIDTHVHYAQTEAIAAYGRQVETVLQGVFSAEALHAGVAAQ
jgi:guanine deaminase